MNFDAASNRDFAGGLVWWKKNSKMADGRHFENGISPYLSEKSSNFDEILYTAADFELDERHVALVLNEKVALDRLRVRQNVFLKTGPLKA